MQIHVNRRSFLQTTGSCIGGLAFLSKLPLVSGQEAALPRKLVQLNPEVEPLARLIEETPRERLLEEMGARIRKGLSYRQLVAALFLAGVRSVEPRPIGFKFHAVLVVNAAHIASLASPDTDRWLPIFWALDNFKESQARNTREGNWRMAPLDEAAVPDPAKARAAFVDAMEKWDAPAADVAIAGLCRRGGFADIFNLFCRFGTRDFHEIGHKIIYPVHAWRLLNTIGWEHAEPILRSLAYAQLDRNPGSNPVTSDDATYQPFRKNLGLVRNLRVDWLAGKPSEEARAEMLDTLRQGSPEDASAKAVELLNKGAATDSLWDAYFQEAGENVMRQPGIVPLHAVTTTNALRFAFQTSGDDETRRLLLVQGATLLAKFRGRPQQDAGKKIDTFDPVAPKGAGPDAVAEIFAEIGRDRMSAAHKALGFLRANGKPEEMIDAARRLVFLKGRDAHDYKFSSAILEDYRHVSPAWRDRYLAASVFNLLGSDREDNKLVARSRAALGS